MGTPQNNGLKKKIKKTIRNMIHLFKEKELVPIPHPVDSCALLQGKVALITGGSSGIGYAMAEAFIRNGCKVVIAGRNKDTLKSALENLSGGGKTHHSKCK